MISNPIFQREVKTSLRDWRVVGLILGFVSLLTILLAALWPTTGVFSTASDSSMQIFAIFLMSCLGLVILLVPALTSPAITSERENKSFVLLFTSLLTPGEVLRGKLFAGLTMIILTLLAAMPIAAMCALSGGIGPWLLLRAFAVIAMAALTYGVVGLAFSALCQRTFTSLMLSYGTVVALAGATWLPYALLGRLYVLRHLWAAIRCLSPFDALYALLFPELYKQSQTSILTQNTDHLVMLHLAGMAVIFIFFLLIFCRYVLSAPKPGTAYRWTAWTLLALTPPIIAIQIYLFIQAQSVPVSPIPGAQADNGGMLKLALGILVDLLLIGGIRNLFKMANVELDRHNNPQDESEEDKPAEAIRRKKAIGRFRNPIFMAEMRSKIFGKPKFIVRGLAACIGISLTLLLLVCTQYANTLRPDTVRWVAVIFQIGIVAALAPAVSSGSISDEITSKTMLMLRMTPISAITVVFGKLKAAFLYVSVFLISSLPVLFSLAYLEVQANYWRLGAWGAVLILTTLACITAGLCASSFCKSTGVATGMSYCFSAVLCVVTFAAELPGAFAPGMRKLILTFNPMVGALRITSDSLFSDLPPDLWIHNIIILGSLSAFFTLVASARLYYLFNCRT